MKKLKLLSLIAAFTRKFGMPKGGFRLLEKLFPPENFNSLDKIIFNYDKNLKCIATPSSFIERRWIFTGGYSNDNEKLLSSFLNKGDMAFDCGANVGTYSLRFGKAVGKTGQVIAFEPLDEPRKRLNENILLNNYSSRVKVSSSAIGENSGHTVFKYPPPSIDNQGNASIFASNDSWLTKKVKLVSIDDYVIDNNISKLNLIRCDAQGGELKDIKGACHAIEKFSPIISIRYNMHLLSEAKNTLEEILTFLSEKGYSAYSQFRNSFIALINTNSITDAQLLFVPTH